MRRRELLRLGCGGIAAAAGCVGGISAPSGPHISVDPMPQPEDTALEFSVEVVHVAGIEAPTLRVSITNTGDSKITFSVGGPRRVFGDRLSLHDDLYLVETDNPRWRSMVRDEGCWGLKSDPTPNFLVIAGHQLRHLQTVSETFVLLAWWDQDSPRCLPEGTYTFTNSYSVHGRERDVVWGFDVTIPEAIGGTTTGTRG